MVVISRFLATIYMTIIVLVYVCFILITVNLIVFDKLKRKLCLLKTNRSLILPFISRLCLQDSF